MTDHRNNSRSAVEVEGLTKTYRLYDGPTARLAEMLTGRPRHIDCHALKGVSFKLERGEAVGIIGRNGSGKSTLLRILAGIIDPSGGAFRVRGRVSSIIDLAAGFIPGFSGIDNAILNCRLMGMAEDEIKSRLPGILEFANIGNYARLAVSSYSSGMLLRLGFGVAQSVDADALLVDEILAVGDLSFQKKCIQRMKQFREQGAAIVLVTHSMADLGGFCDRVIQLDDGVVVRDGPTETVIAEYIEQMQGGNGHAGAPFEEHSSPYRERTGKVIIRNVEIIGPDGKQTARIKSGQALAIRFSYSATEPVDNPLFRLQIHSSGGALVHGTNTYRRALDLGRLSGDGAIEIHYDSFNLLQGRYYLTAGIYPDEYSSSYSDKAHDERRMAYTIDVESGRGDGAGIAFMPHKWERVP